MQKKTGHSEELVLRVQRQAQERAAELARRVPWQVLLEARNHYLEWQEFYYWARSIMKSEECLPDWLSIRLDQMCPGFVAERLSTARHPKDVHLAPIRLGQWIDEHIFDFAAKAGWLSAITFYAVREPRYQKASACWSESVNKWRKAKPHAYPSFEEWCCEAQPCDESAHLLAEVRRERECFKLVDPERLAEAVSRCIDWEAFAYWAWPALEHKEKFLVSEVVQELDARCPGFVEFNAKSLAADRQLPNDSDRLMLWIGEHFFHDPKAEGWYDAILISARIHPRAIRTMEYSDHCHEVWNASLLASYPSFKAWRRDADRYVDVESH